MHGRYYGVPYRLPGDVNEIRINERCLQPPHIYRDLDGYFCMPPVIRRVSPGLVSAPGGFEVQVQPLAKLCESLPIVARMQIDLDSLTKTLPVFRFSVDEPKWSNYAN